MQLSVSPSLPPPAPVGAAITWTASADPDSESVRYRFRVRSSPDGNYQVVQDYGLSETLVWAAAEHEGTYEIEVSARDASTGESAEAIVPYAVAGRVGPGGNPVVSATSNPLTFLYSAPPCAPGSRMRVEMTSPESQRQATPYKACQDSLSMNFYLAGMRANAVYLVHHTIDNGSGTVSGPELTVAVPDVTAPLPGYTVLQRPAWPLPGGVLLHSPTFQSPVATDLEGNVVWFYPGNVSFLTRPVAGGSFWGIVEDYTAGPVGQLLREFDLAGLTVRETNAARVNEQLAALGMNPIGAFHHEALSLPDGGVLTLASTERILTGVQGPGPVDVLGDMILALDRDMRVVWAWDAFDHLDPARLATLGEICAPGIGGCPPFYMAQQANDWLHGNALQLLHDGGILYSARHQDWIIKIDYANGSGSGQVLWRLGREGDFAMDSSDPDPWFSHQHGPEFQPGDGTLLAVFDNGNVRYTADAAAKSRGQVLHLDESNRKAWLTLNADLGDYSFALGSAHLLPNGDYHFDMGWLPAGTSWSIEVDGEGNTIYCMESAVPDYRSFRMPDLYRP